MNDLFDQARMNMNIVFETEQIAEFEREKRMVKENLVLMIIYLKNITVKESGNNYKNKEKSIMINKYK